MAKSNGTIWVKMGITILVILAAVITSFVWVQADVEAVSKQTDVNSADIKVLDLRADTIDRTMIRVETRQEIMLESLDEIKEKLK